MISFNLFLLFASSIDDPGENLPEKEAQKERKRLFRLIEESHRHLFRLTCQYARINSRSIAVLSKTREPKLQKLEEIYFHNLADGYPFHFILADKSENEFAY